MGDYCVPPDFYTEASQFPDLVPPYPAMPHHLTVLTLETTLGLMSRGVSQLFSPKKLLLTVNLRDTKGQQFLFYKDLFNKH